MNRVTSTNGPTGSRPRAHDTLKARGHEQILKVTRSTFEFSSQNNAMVAFLIISEIVGKWRYLKHQFILTEYLCTVVN